MTTPQVPVGPLWTLVVDPEESQMRHYQATEVTGKRYWPWHALAPSLLARQWKHGYCPSVGEKSIRLVGAAPHVTCNYCYMENLLNEQRFAPTFIRSAKQVRLISVCLF